MAAAILVWIYRWSAGVLPHQWGAPVLVQPNLDLTYWLFIGSGAAYFFSNGAPAYCLSFLLLGLPILNIFYRNKPISAYISGFYSLILMIYALLFNTYSSIHTSYLYGLWFASLAFWAFDAARFGLAWQALRYYTCWIYASAFGWKLVRGFWNYPLHAKAIIMHENAAYLLQNPNTYLAQALNFLIQHEQFAHYFLNIGMLIQGAFIIGFFTKKYDKWLFWLPFFFHFMTYFLLDVAFFEFLILQLVFVKNEDKIKQD
jgi:hypothetical protein